MQTATGEQLADRTSVRTMADLASSAAERFGDKAAVRVKRGEEWQETTFAEVNGIVEEIALGLIDLGIEAGERVCILANTRPEWTYANLAVTAIGAVVVPIYPTNSPEECEWVAGDSQAKAVFCEDPEQAAKIAEIRGSLSDLEHVILFDGSADGAMSVDEVRTRARGNGDREELQSRQDAVSPEDAYTIIYTSGTTGPPKGCVITHGNCAVVCSIVQELEFVADDEVTYLYLPLAHIFAVLIQIGSFETGSTIIYFGGDPRQIIPELAETTPTYFPSVPRIFEKLYTMGRAALDKAPPEEQERFEKAVKLGVEVRSREARGEDVPEDMRAEFDQADEKYFAGVRKLFGGQVRQAVSGAAPIAPDILEFFYAAGVPVLEGWGMTESIGVGTVNLLDDFKFGTVGKPVPGCEIRIADDDNEILMRGPHIFAGYWRNEEATRETLDDEGWLHTGDVGELDDGFLKITGRKKDIIITAGGKNLTPSNIENDLKQSRWISQAVMHGDRRPFPVALITLDAEEIVPWAKEQGLPEDPAELAEHEKVNELIEAEVERVNKRHAKVAQIKKFFILERDLTQEDGELTPTMKIKRNVVNDKFADRFEALYSG